MGLGNQKDEIRGWLEEEFGAVDETGAVATVVLQHIAHNGEAQVWASKPGGPKWGDPTGMAETVDAVATRHARGISAGGMQQFQLSITRGSDSRVCGVLPFTRSSPSHLRGIDGSLATEPPNGMGQTQQGMRQAEIIVQGMIAQINPTFKAQADLIERLMGFLTQKEKDNADLWLGVKNLLLELDNRRHQERLSELNAARMAAFQRQAMTLAPAVLNMMAGREVFPTSTADTAFLDTILEWASPDDIRVITGALAGKSGGEAIAATLTDRYKRFHERKEAEAAEERRLLKNMPGRTFEEGERDAMGDAVRILRGQGSAPVVAQKVIADQAVIRAIDEGKVGTNGNGHALPPAAAPEETPEQGFIRKLFEGSSPEQVKMMAGIFEAQGKTELAKEILERFAKLQT